MDLNEQIEALRQQVVALQEQMQIVLMMLAEPAPGPVPQSAPAPEPEPQVITDFTQINFPI